MEQGSAEWHAARLGKATASRVADIIARTKSGWSTSRENYLAELVVERLTGVAYEGYSNAAMAWGTQMEPEARAQYAFVADVDVEEVAFVPHPRITMAGASPDGLIGAEGLVEIKCPQSATHIATLLGEPIAGKYVTQMMWQMACTGRAWCDWVSWDPRLPDYARIHIKRIHRDDKVIADLEKAVEVFLAEVDDRTEQIRALGHG